jgi:hypothetical protein
MLISSLARDIIWAKSQQSKCKSSEKIWAYELTSGELEKL